MNRLENLFYVRIRAGRSSHPLWKEPAGVIASRILDEGYGEMTDVRPVGARPGFNIGWPRLPDFVEQVFKLVLLGTLGLVVLWAGSGDAPR
jgi:hypothetical protein